MRRSEQRESEIAQLVEEGIRPADHDVSRFAGKSDLGQKGLSRDTPKSSRGFSRGANMKSAVHETLVDATPSRWMSPRLGSEPHRRSASYMSSPVDRIDWNQYPKHPGTHKQERFDPNRSMSTSGSRRSLDVHPDFGNEYIRGPDSPTTSTLNFNRSHARASLEQRKASIHTRRQSMPATSRSTVYSEEYSGDLHTQNLYAALQRAENGPNSESPVVDSLGQTVRLADTVNQGLRQAIRASLEVRMSLTLSPSLESVENLLDTLNVTLSQLLKQSDDHVRSLTDTLIAYDRDQRPIRRSQTWRHASPPHTALSDTSMGNSSIHENGETPSPISRNLRHETSQRNTTLGLTSKQRPTFSMYEPMEAIDRVAAQTKQRQSAFNRSARTSPWTTPIHSRLPGSVLQRENTNRIHSPSSLSLWPQSNLTESNDISSSSSIADRENHPDLSNDSLGGGIRQKDGYFVDKFGRCLLLRGVNLAGISKIYANHETVSFVDRPFPLDEAPEHFARLKHWGLTLVRLLVTWEALSHSGPCPAYDIDRDYVTYLRSLLVVMEQYGLKCIICAHQDVWSRLCGGSGAPGWTLLAAGFDLTHLNATGSALIPEVKDHPMKSSAPPGKSEPTGAFNWPSGYQKLAPATMATLFWAGRTFAPNLCLHKDNAGNAKPQNIQDFLQESYMTAYTLLVQAVSSCEAYLGFDVINEPHRGLINLISFDRWCYETDLHIGHFPSALQSMALGDCHPQSVPFYVKSWPFPSRISHTSRITPAQSVWLDPDQNSFSSTRNATGCLWREHGVWAWDENTQKPIVLQADYFSVDPRAGYHRRPVEFYNDFYAPFVNRLAERMHHLCPEAMLLVEPVPNEFMPHWGSHSGSPRNTADTITSCPLPQNFVYAPHFYDLNVLFFKAYNGMSVNVQGLSRGMFILRAIYFGTRGLAKNYYRQLRQLTTAGYESLGRVPILVGEVGIPFDVNNTLQKTPGNYCVQNKLLGSLVTSLERNLISFTLWNYNPRNTVEYGDAWNQEDFSLINLEDTAADQGNLRRNEVLYLGGRALDAVLRPYVCKVDGVPLSTFWDARRSTLHFDWRNTSQSGGQPTEVYVPDYLARGVRPEVRLSDGSYRYDAHHQTLYIFHLNQQPNARHSLALFIPKEKPSDDQGIVVLLLCGLLAVIVAYLALNLFS